jgi:hypothetical protein
MVLLEVRTACVAVVTGFGKVREPHKRAKGFVILATLARTRKHQHPFDDLGMVTGFLLKLLVWAVETLAGVLTDLTVRERLADSVSPGGGETDVRVFGYRGDGRRHGFLWLGVLHRFLCFLACFAFLYRKH